MQARRFSANSPSVSKQRRLPRLPVPHLRDTLDRYLKSIEPFLLEESVRTGVSFDEEISKRIKWAKTFELGLGEVCQRRLIGLDKISPNNWLDDNFWLKKAYHEWRAPLLINSNWWLALQDDSNVPSHLRNGHNAQPLAGITPWQVRRAAWLLHRLLQFKSQIESQELYPDMSRTGLWIRDTIPRIFNICRVPETNCDRLTTPDLSSPASRKIIVMLHNRCYAIEVYDGSGQTIELSEIERRIREVVVDAEKRMMSKEEKATSISVLTADDRDTWAANREYLMTLSDTNRSTMNTIESSILALSLDHYTLNISHAEPSSKELPEIDYHLHNARSGFNAHNRWFDKPFTLIVESSTRASVMGEHSPCDALIPSIAAEYALAEDIDVDAFSIPISSSSDVHASSSHSRNGWERLDWVVDERIRRETVQAEKRAKAIISDSDDSVMWFTDYGAEWIKNTARLSPDAYIQMAMQLAWYRMRGSFTAVYETALTRLFLQGRTETIRSFSTASRTFVLSMMDPSVENDIKFKHLREAVSSHGRLTKEAMTGKGIDRHLLGLRLVMREGESCQLFDDQLFAQTQEWKLSTSGLGAGLQFRGTGFGTTFADGYGINYLAGPNVIKFGIESKHSSSKTSTSGFQHVLSDVLSEMYDVCSHYSQSSFNARL